MQILCTQLYGFKYFSTTIKHQMIGWCMYGNLTRKKPINLRCLMSNNNETVIPHIQDFQKYSLPSRCHLVSYPQHPFSRRFYIRCTLRPFTNVDVFLVITLIFVEIWTRISSQHTQVLKWNVLLEFNVTRNSGYINRPASQRSDVCWVERHPSMQKRYGMWHGEFRSLDSVFGIVWKARDF